MLDKYNLPVLNREKLLTPQTQTLLKNKSFQNTSQPVLWLIAHNHASKNFYQQVAHALELEFLESLPVKINDSKSLANKVGAEVQSKYLFFAYLEADTLIIATPDPTAIQEMVQHTLPFLVNPPQNIQIKICPLSVIREALQQSAYLISGTLAEDQLKKSRPHLSSYAIFKPATTKIFLAGLILFLIIFAFFPSPIFFGIYVFVNLFYFLLNPVKFLITLAGIFRRLPNLSGRKLKKLPAQNLPVYTVLIPLKNEEAVAAKLIEHLKTLDYPPDKLDVKIIAEVDDAQTLAAVRKTLNLRDHSPESLIFDIVKVPLGEVSTKPRSLNFALQFARGSLSVIYDAEDRPEKNQLRKAFAALLDQKLNTLCVQAKLNYYNSRQNLLTRFFTLEYSFWFDVLLPGLQAWRIPIPLGGTSNHFLTESLRQIGMWDPYNVTEDADLGWRLARLGYTTTMVDSYTWEEANSQVWNWIKQRTRWQKGFLMTLLVHLRTPRKMWQELGPWGFFSSILLFTTNFFLPVINPFLWLFFLAWYLPLLFGLTFIHLPIPHWLELAGLVNLLFGNGAYIFTHAVGVIKIKRYDLLPLALLLPFYWFLLSFASYRAIWQIFKDPYSWEKTTHGLAK